MSMAKVAETKLSFYGNEDFIMTDLLIQGIVTLLKLTRKYILIIIH